MITNIYSQRSRQYRWMQVDAVIEPTWQDNSCKDADRCDPAGWDGASVYEGRKGVSIAEAVAWANGAGYPVTLYLYDAGTLDDADNEPS